MKFSILIFLFCISIVFGNDNNQQCQQFSNLEDKAIISMMKNMPRNFIVDNFESCIEILITKGHFEALEYFINELMKRGIKFKDHLNESINNYNTHLNGLKNKFKFKENDYQKVTPAIRWAQNKEYVFIEIKFSHRFDTPGCPEVEEEFFDIVNGNQIVFHAYCSIGDVPIKFDLNLNLFDEVVKLRSTWGVASAQKFHATLRKSDQNEDWDSFLKEGSEQLNNLQKWFEMDEKFKESEDDKQNNDDDEDDDEIIETKSKKKNRRKKNFNPLMPN